ncbi:MAG: hypothetical protein H6713_14460 [Myxococcales bacterium]|nr:hypothetical protein [Myxococcales bacterium]
MELIAHMLGAALLVNSVPHTVQGVSGKPFQTPFASPPGIGLSPPSTNALWGGANAIAGILLLFGVGELEVGLDLHTTLVLGAGLLAAFGLARYFERLADRLP